MIPTLKKYQAELKAVRQAVKNEPSRINKKGLRERAEHLGTRWFSEILPLLSEGHGFEPDLLDQYSTNFRRLIKVSAPNNRKKSYTDTLDSLLRRFRDDLILPAQQSPKRPVNESALAALIGELPDPEESDYWEEALQCAGSGYLRASVVLGWCAAIDRIHRKIETGGFSAFNVNSARMASQTKGRFKRFSSVQNVNSLSELRQVFDTIVLWVVEGMGLIDSNQHTRLRSCFDMRCQCAHPGQAPLTEYNVMSFFSDIDQIVLRNPAFEIPHPQ